MVSGLRFFSFAP
ncbi:hypothetical protein E2C01_065840 [Portunus trituberculatus]|uniref:Uncharacterized protein n=1 Tax=Portunus trituberculatus TaxID=210409 RepID=A0A5B7HJY7_PORTR|nr:hypothetical protein [Portunus trituberculatus]